MTKFKQIYLEMVEQNKDLFKDFERVHAQYNLEPEKWRREFNKIGSEILDVVRRYENRLCRHSEGSGYGQYTTSLAEKFQEEVRSHFPKIDDIGLLPNEHFTFKKIKLS